MWKRYLVLYWFGLFYSVMIGGSIIFIYSQHVQKGAQKGDRLIYDADHGAALFEKYRTEMEMLEDYYERIEDCDFSHVSFAPAGKDTYECYSSYIDKGYITAKEYVPKGFLDHFLEEDGLSREGSRVTIFGDHWEDIHIFLDTDRTALASRILVVTIAADLETMRSAFYLYSPGVSPVIDDSFYDNIVIEPLEDGWYYIFVEKTGVEVCY